MATRTLNGLSLNTKVYVYVQAITTVYQYQHTCLHYNSIIQTCEWLKYCLSNVNSTKLICMAKSTIRDVDFLQ